MLFILFEMVKKLYRIKVRSNPAGAQAATSSFQLHIRQIIQQMMELQYWRQMPQDQQQQHVMALQHLVQTTLTTASNFPLQQQHQQSQQMDALINAPSHAQGVLSSQQTAQALRYSPTTTGQVG